MGAYSASLGMARLSALASGGRKPTDSQRVIQAALAQQKAPSEEGAFRFS